MNRNYNHNYNTSNCDQAFANSINGVNKTVSATVGLIPWMIIGVILAIVGNAAMYAIDSRMDNSDRSDVPAIVVNA